MLKIKKIVKFLIGLILRFCAYMAIIYSTLVVPMAFIFYKSGRNPFEDPESLQKPIGLVVILFTAFYFSFKELTILLTRLVMLILTIILNFSVIILSLFGNMEIKSFLVDPFSHESTISGLFLASPVLFAMASFTVFTFIFFAKGDIDQALGVESESFEDYKNLFRRE